MNKFKKIKSKLFKSKQPKDHKLRHSLSMPPLRSSSETEEVTICGSPGPNDIPVKPEQRYPDWFQCQGDPDDFTRPYFPRRPYVEIVDQFPAPPTTVPEKPQLPIVDAKPKRPSVRPPTLDLSQFPEELLPEYPPQLKAKIDAFDAAEAARNAARLRAGHRTASSVSGQTQPLNICRRGASNSNVPVQPSSGMYRNHCANQSTRSLDPRARHRNHQAGDAGTHNTSNSGSTMYRNYSAAHSAYNLSANARYQASFAGNHPTNAVPSLPHDQQQDHNNASVCRRNASSASSRSAHDMRRHGMLPAAEGVQYHEIFRVLRGPHAVKLQTPAVHTRTNEYIGLPVNDTNSKKAWRAKSFRAVGVTGYGRVQHH
ncbi:hypothetical protein C0995_004282 [Termitomyces sp. Mi166|nr:hypothetical protein C0995_004282 [Termitomyces sp. Mi166\